MQTEPRSPEPQLATLFALVGGILGLTGVGVTSYLAQDAARSIAPVGACAENGPRGCDEADVTPPAPGCDDLTEVATPRGSSPCAKIKVG